MLNTFISLWLPPFIPWLQDHAALVREREGVERQLNEERVLVEQQKRRMEEMEVGVAWCTHIPST